MANYLMLTVDTEALPNRAKDNHVDRLILGIHENGTAGVKEMASITSEFGGSMVFFTDICGALQEKDKILETAKWLDQHGQDVELHLHPEYLPKEYWNDTPFEWKPKLLNVYEEKKLARSIKFTDIYTHIYYASREESETNIIKPSMFKKLNLVQPSKIQWLVKNNLIYDYMNNRFESYIKSWLLVLLNKKVTLIYITQIVSLL